MAYLREEKQKIEIDYPIEKVWDAVPEVAKTIEWTVEEKNDETHKAKLRTKKGFLSYSTIMNVEAVSVDEQTTRVSINAETP